MLVIVLSPQAGQAVVEAGGSDDLMVGVEDSEWYEGSLEECDQLGVVIEQIELSLILLSNEAVQCLDIVVVSPPDEVIIDHAWLLYSLCHLNLSYILQMPASFK